MATCAIRDYDNIAGGGVRASWPTGHVQNGYTRRVDGRFIRADGLDLSSGYAGKLLIHPNGSKAASQIFDSNERALCR